MKHLLFVLFGPSLGSGFSAFLTTVVFLNSIVSLNYQRIMSGNWTLPFSFRHRGRGHRGNCLVYLSTVNFTLDNKCVAFLPQFFTIQDLNCELCYEQVQMGHRLQSSAHMWHFSCLGQWDALFKFMTNKTQEKLIIDCEILSINVVNIYPKLILQSVCDARRHSDHDYPGLHRSNYSDNYLLQWGKCVDVDTLHLF